MKKEYILEGLGCANCAAKIEAEAGQLKGIKSSNLDFLTTTLSLQTDPNFDGDITKQVESIVKSHEPSVKVIDKDSITDEAKESEENNIHISHIRLIRAGISLIIFLIAFIFNFSDTVTLVLYIIAYLIAGYDVIITALKNILKGKVFDENFLMGIATIGAFLIGEYPEGVAVMIFYQIGEYFQDAAVNKSRKSIAGLMDIRPDYANIIINGEIKKVSPDEVKIDDIIIVKPGEKVPLDGIVASGSSMLNTTALTGESMPRAVKEGDSILSGCINESGVLTVKVTKLFGESTVSKILDMVQNASSKKSPTENFITTFAKYYTPAVVLLAALIAVIPPLLFDGVWNVWINRALIFLVISCPCALVISIPLGFFGGIGGASSSGILIKGGNFLEALSKTDTVVFDKTGTLTHGVFEVANIIPANSFNEEQLLEYAAYAESLSNHPIALSILKSYNNDIQDERLSEFKEQSGYGTSVKLDDFTLLAGNANLMEKEHIVYTECNEIGTKIYVAVNGIFAGCIVISDKIKEDSKSAIENLKKSGICKVIMLTGDNDAVGKSIAEELKLDEVYTELLPTQKVEKLEEILSKKENPKGKLAFVGDGINDAPVLARADVGVAMGGLGSDAAIEAADIVLMTDEPSKLVNAIRISKYTKKIVNQNIVFALACKAVIMVLGAVGIATMWAAVFADVGVCIIAVINSMRAMKAK